MEKKTKSANSGKTKSTVKKTAKQPLAKVNATAKKATAKKTVKKTAADIKPPVVKAKKAPSAVKAKKAIKKKEAEPVKQVAITRIIAHGRDRHLIPDHKEGMVQNAHDNIGEENAFHNREEVALHQENQKVKVGMVSKTDRRRIFNSQGRR